MISRGEVKLVGGFMSIDNGWFKTHKSIVLKSLTGRQLTKETVVGVGYSEFSDAADDDDDL